MQKLITSLIFTLLFTNIFAQNNEHYLRIYINDRSEIETLTRIVSIDNVIGNEVIAFANDEQFERFLTLNIPYEILKKPVLTPEELNMMDFEAIKNCRNDWNYYPNYQAYLDMMDEFVTNYPDICRKVEFGTSVQNRKLWALVLSNNVHVREAEPQVFFTSSMHGDELTGYVLTLRYIDYLLSNYGTDDQVTNLLDNMEIWVNPLANPDGTFHGGNNTVSGAWRENANNRDLNRNYKDWYYGDHPDGYQWQKETLAFMDLQNEQSFVLGVNLHGGSEVCNYPWDNRNAIPADDAWWQLVCWEYANTVHQYSPSSYLSLYGGVVRGYAWYSITGSRQDYTNYYDHNREFCLEISNTKTPSASQLPNFWNYNYRSFLKYTQQALYGIHGVVTDACSGEPVEAKISVPQDVNNSFVMTDPRVGFYARPIKGGTYSVTYSATGYEPQTVSITVADYQKVVQNISLNPVGMLLPAANFEADVTEIFTDETVQFTDLSQNVTAWEWYFEGGTPETSAQQNPEVLYKNIGSFDVRLKVYLNSCSNELLMENFITVKQMTYPPVANFEADTTEIFENEKVSFTDLSQNADEWEWFFEGGTPETSTEQNPVVVYKNSGVFDVKLTASNDDGSDEMWMEHYITVKKTPPIADFEANSTEIFENETVIFVNLSQNATAWEWFFEGGTPETAYDQNPVVLYEKQGSFSVKLTAINEDGSDEMLKENYIFVQMVAINETDDVKVAIYPNPASQESTLTVDSDSPLIQIEFFNLSGASVIKFKPTNTPYTLSVSDLEKGVYLMRIETRKGVCVSKIQIQ